MPTANSAATIDHHAADIGKATPIAPPAAASTHSKVTADRSESPMATRRCDE